MLNLKKTYSPIHLFTYSPRGGFTIIEVVVVFLIILGVTFFMLPKSLDNTKQARFISKWTQTYSEMEYMFSVIKTQQGSEIEKEFNNSKDININNCVIPELFKPYLRITSDLKNPKYNQSYMNMIPVTIGEHYYFSQYYLNDAKEIISLKWTTKNCKDNLLCAVMAFDVNGEDPPNTWGYDVFGINVFKDRIEPIGKNMDPNIIKNDCSKNGLGIYCSYYYLIGGRFD